jgi:hypothetical protein
LLVVLSAMPALGSTSNDLRLVYASGVAGEIEPCG